MNPDGRRLGRMVAASVLLHAALVLVPGSWWAALASRNAGDRAPGPAEGPVAVSLVAWPAAAPAGPPRPRPEPAATTPAPAETPPVPEPRPQPESAAAPSPAAAPAGAPAPAGTTGASAAESPAEAPASGGGPGDRLRYRPPKLLAGALPLTPEESEGLPSPLEINVRLRVDSRGRVAEIVPEDPDLPAPLRRALERSARAMRFAPARLGDRPVAGWFEMSFVYRR